MLFNFVGSAAKYQLSEKISSEDHFGPSNWDLLQVFLARGLQLEKISKATTIQYLKVRLWAIYFI